MLNDVGGGVIKYHPRSQGQDRALKWKSQHWGNITSLPLSPLLPFLFPDSLSSIPRSQLPSLDSSVRSSPSLLPLRGGLPAPSQPWSSQPCSLSARVFSPSLHLNHVLPLPKVFPLDHLPNIHTSFFHSALIIPTSFPGQPSPLLSVSTCQSVIPPLMSLWCCLLTLCVTIATVPHQWLSTRVGSWNAPKLMETSHTWLKFHFPWSQVYLNNSVVFLPS